MSYISLSDAKKHLNITSSEDDDYLTRIIIPAAEDAVQEELCRSLDMFENPDGVLPAALQQAILLTIGDFYANRETTAFTSTSTITAVGRLKNLYRDYNA